VRITCTSWIPWQLAVGRISPLRSSAKTITSTALRCRATRFGKAMTPYPYLRRVVPSHANLETACKR
jgi:hypothetical protein